MVALGFLTLLIQQDFVQFVDVVRGLPTDVLCWVINKVMM